MNCKLEKRYKWKSDKKSNIKEKWLRILNNKMRESKEQ